MTPQEVADQLQLSPATLAFWRHADRGPRFVRVGRHIRYHPADIDSFLASCEEGGGRA